MSNSNYDRQRLAHHDIKGGVTKVLAFTGELRMAITEISRLTSKTSDELPKHFVDSINELINEDLNPCSDYLNASANTLQKSVTDYFVPDSEVFDDEEGFSSEKKNLNERTALDVTRPDTQNESQQMIEASTDRTPLHLLAVDDDPEYAQVLARYLRSDPQYLFTIENCSDPLKGIELCQQEEFDLLLVDYNLPHLTGVKFIESLQDIMNNSAPPSIILTADSDQEIAGDALRANAADFLSKNALTRTALSRSIHNSVYQYRLQQSVFQKTAQLECANEELVEKNREIYDFYQNVSHEVKTPLAAAREFISIVHDILIGPINPEQSELLGLALESCDQITDHFNNLVDIIRLDAGKASLSPATTTLDSLLKRSLASCAHIVNEKDVQIETQIDLDSDCNLFIDKNRIIQVLSNLLGNATKYAPPGSIIGVGVYPADDQKIEFCVSDTGPGIAEHELSKIFNRLYQSTDIHKESTGAGLGLGLSIAREIVHLHGGEIWVESEVGKGCQFYFRIPMHFANTAIAA